MQDPLALAMLLVAFLIGAIPTGFFIGKGYGVDIRTVGSGNIGTTNIGRTLGRKAGAITFLGDLLKGAVAVLLLRSYASPPLLALFAVAGHCYSPFLKFRGGKGVATAFGAFLAFAPAATLFCCAIFVGVVFTTGYVSLASIASAALFPAVYAALDVHSRSVETLLPIVCVTAVIVSRHRSNIKRLRSGTERRMKRHRSNRIPPDQEAAS